MLTQACGHLRLAPSSPAAALLGRTLHTSPTACGRMTRRVASAPEWKRKKLAEGPWWKEPVPVPHAPISKTFHPPNKFADIESRLQDRVAAASSCDLPVSDMADPYEKEPKTCVLCPRRYAVPVIPNYKNPKLLSQFVSLHTGKMYETHITGLCEYMQGVVSKEVDRSRAAGFMSSKIKSPHYLQDPALFNPTRPVKKNPY
jgi:small subunit ribosomal protein S18